MTANQDKPDRDDEPPNLEPTVLQPSEAIAEANLQAFGDMLKEDLKQVPPPREPRYPKGTKFGNYEVISFVEPGGFAEVYQACKPGLTTARFAVKVIRKANNSTVFADALNEARKAEAVRHDNVVRIEDVGETPEVAYIVMEYVEGGSLAQRLREAEGGKLPPAEARDVIFQALLGLAAGWDGGLVHRDVKPGNILLTTKAWKQLVKIADFGIAAFTDQLAASGGSVANPGTPAYMAPELLGRDPTQATPASDQFALGVTFYQLLMGTLPPQLPGVKNCKLNPREVEPSVPEDCARIVEKMTAEKPEDRYTDVGQLLQELRGVTASSGATPKRWFTIRLVLALTLTLGVCLLLSLLGVWLGREAFHGGLRMCVTERAGKREQQGLSLHAEGTLPLRAGDWVSITAQLDRGPEGYFYLVWIDSAKKVDLKFPADWKWGQLPAGESRLRELVYPGKGEEIQLQPSQPGIEGLLLLVRSKPLTKADNAALERLLSEMKWKQPEGWRKAVTYLEDGKIVEDYGSGGNIRSPDDPVSQMQSLMDRLHKDKLVDYSLAVCYPFGTP
jgi:hypothetical protein